MGKAVEVLSTTNNNTHMLTFLGRGVLFFRFKQWYPVAIIDDLDPSLPMHAQLLGLDLAVWWDSNASQWRCVLSSFLHEAPSLHTTRTPLRLN